MEDIEHILGIGKETKLSQEEKNQMKSVLISRMRESGLQKFSSDMSWYIFIRKHAIVSAFVAILFLTGSTSALAEKTAPGDLLYPLKTGVNEQVLGLFATSPNAKALWQVSLAERRLTEAEHIALSDNPEPQVSDSLLAQVDDHIKQASEQDGIHDDEVVENEAPVVATTLAKSESTEGSAPRFAAFKSASLAPTTTDATSSIKIESHEDVDGVIEKIHNVKSRLSQLKAKRDNGKNRVRTEIELLNAKKELFQVKDSENKKTAEDLTNVVHDQIEKSKKIEDESKETERESGEIDD